MSFAIIQTGGKQYKVSASEILKIERLKESVGKTVEFKKILLLNNDKETEIGTPTIEGAKVEAKILKNGKNKTILVFKKRRRKNSRKKFGHRQQISLIQIMKIFSKNGKLIAEAKDLNKEKSQKAIPENKEMAEKKKVEVPKQKNTKTKKKPLSKSKK
jgi:large subunit ribosomal protein L21